MSDSALWHALGVSPSHGPAVRDRLRACFCGSEAAPDAPLLVHIISSGLPETISISNAELWTVYIPLLLWFKMRATACTRRRCLIGIAGPAGSGKTTLAALTEVMMNAMVDADFPRTAKIEMDGYHLTNVELDELGLRRRKGVIETICGTALAADLVRLNLGERASADLALADAAPHVGPLRTRPNWSIFDSDDGALWFPDYDRLGTHDPRLRARRVSPDVRLVIVEGLFIARGDGGGGALPLGPDADAWARVRACLDEVVMISAPLSLCRARCLARRARTLLPAEGEPYDALLVGVTDHYRRNDAPSWHDINADASRSTLRLKIPLAPSFASAEAEAGDALDVPWHVALEALKATAHNPFEGLTVD